MFLTTGIAIPKNVQSYNYFFIFANIIREKCIISTENEQLYTIYLHRPQSLRRKTVG